jgi:hypothetical protein
MLGVLFALIALLLGWAVCRALGLPLALAPVAGLAALAVSASWTVAAALPLTPVMVVLVGVSVLVAVRRPARFPDPTRADIPTIALLAFAALVPAALLGIAFAGLDVPTNNHDGIYHVEIVDALRRGVHFDTWYPRGYHAAIAAVIGLAPWVDSARGTAEASEGLSVLATLAVFGLGRALGARAIVAALAAAIQALTFIYPYDYHTWGGWPLGMSVVLLLGVWTAALAWIETPRLPLAALMGVCAGAILLTHGTEVYTASLGLLVIVALRARAINWRALVRQLPLAAGLALALAAPYLPLLLGWARAGGAVSVANASQDFDVLAPELQGGGIWIQIGLGALGAVGFIDLPVRAALIAVGLSRARAGLTRGLWLSLVIVLVAFALPEPAPLQWVFRVTFPWLADQRLLQVASIFASLLAADGLVTVLAWLALRRAPHPRLARRVAIAVALVCAFVAEGSGVSIYKSLAQAAVSQGSFSSDDRRAMAWLRQQARTGGDTLANDAAVDAGIWAPYKTGLPILLPRAAMESDTAERQIVRDNIASLNEIPSAHAAACQLGLRYVYYGSRVYADEVHHFPSPVVLARSDDLVEAFRSGDAVVFRTRLSCT